MYSVIPIWVVEDDKGNQFGTYYTNEEANRVRSALVKASELAASPQDTDSTEAVEASHDPVEFGSDVPETVEPMADLSGDTWDHFNSALAREMSNGSLPETE